MVAAAMCSAPVRSNVGDWADGACMVADVGVVLHTPDGDALRILPLWYY